MCSAQCEDSVHSDTNRHCVLQMLCTSHCALEMLLDTVRYRCCAVLQCVAVCCSVLQCVAVCTTDTTRHGALEMLSSRQRASHMLL